MGFLRQRPGSEERRAEYDAIREGQAPADRQFAGYRVDKADAPAVDAQQAGGAFQRLTFSVVVSIGALGAVALLGFLSLAVILAQVIALVLLGFAPVALVIGIFPGAGHAFFRGWLAKLATAVFIKALHSLVIAIVVAVSAALTASTGSLGFLFAFALQTIFFWAIFLYRKQITSRLVSATVGAADAPSTPRMTVVQKGAHAATKPFMAVASVSRPGSGRQESALAGSAEQTSSRSDATSSSSNGASSSSSAPATSANGHDTSSSTKVPSAPLVTSGNGPVVSPSSNGDGRFARVTPGDPLRAAAPTSISGSAPAAPSSIDHPPATDDKLPAPAPPSANGSVSPREPHVEPTPRASHEDVMRRARELRERQREAIPSDWDHG